MIQSSGYFKINKKSPVKNANIALFSNKGIY